MWKKLTASIFENLPIEYMQVNKLNISSNTALLALGREIVNEFFSFPLLSDSEIKLILFYI